MATSKEKLAESLKVLQAIQDEDGSAIFKSSAISRTHKTRLLKAGFILEVMKGWYITADPREPKGSSTSWYTLYWQFCEKYLTGRFGKKWCLSPEQSLTIYSGNWSIPKQLMVRSPRAKNNITRLLFDNTIVDAVLNIPDEKGIIKKNGIRLFSPERALAACAPNYYKTNSAEVRILLSTMSDISVLLAHLLEGGNSQAAGRIAGAFNHIGMNKHADTIMKTMKSAGYDVRITDPFNSKIAFNTVKHTDSIYGNRISILWQQYRGIVLQYFPEAPGTPVDSKQYIIDLEDSYKTDAYHSLSIEGYRVSPELIERVMTGKWNPMGEIKDRVHIDAMAARGYYQAFESVKSSIKKILSGKNAGKMAEHDHGEWYRQMFAPSVTAGIIKPSDLAGYRTGRVYISQSSYIPPAPDEVRSAMPVLFNLLAKEEAASVRAVLGHFIFVYIHPYMDGNGRIARFLMNAMLASGGYPWTIIPYEQRSAYMEALEMASAGQDISHFVKFLAKLVGKRIKQQR